MGIRKFDVDNVESWLRRLVINIQGSIVIVLAVYLCLGWTFNRQGEASIAGRFCVDLESVVDMCLALNQTVSIDLDSCSVSHLLCVDHDLERRVGDVFALPLN